jgi:nitroimidazol reductase NimA-like FMN-containing flavoprotein (pyridoxamine 5'-phosphate oxidase superfamily)
VSGSSAPGSDGAPHVIPIWGAWAAGRWYVEGGPTRWQRNLRENPQLAIHIEIGDEVVIVEGGAVELVAPGPPLRDVILTGFQF